MSLVVEIEADGRKAGRVCDRDYRRGNSCPLIVRTTSEDVLTAEVFGLLRRLPPVRWLRPLLSAAYPAQRLGHLRDVGVDFWSLRAPPESRTIPEGETEVDVMVRHDDCALFIEVKYLAQLATRTTYDPTRDQLARLIDVAWTEFLRGRTGTAPPRVMVLGLDTRPPDLVLHYQQAENVERILSPGDSTWTREAASIALARGVAYMSWTGLAQLLELEIARAAGPLQWLLADLVRYIRHRVHEGHETLRARSQLHLPMIGSAIAEASDAPDEPSAPPGP